MHGVNPINDAASTEIRLLERGRLRVVVATFG
jgi:hypothetical protein